MNKSCAVIRYLSEQDGTILLRITCCVPQEKFPTYWIFYWASLVGEDDWILASLMFFFKLWTSTQFWSINLQRRKFSNIQPSWLHIWSITYIYRLNLWVMQQELERHKTSLCAFELIYTWRILSVNSSLIWVCIFCFLLTLRKAFCVLIEINHSDTIFFICNRHMDNNEKEKRLAAMMENAK